MTWDLIAYGAVGAFVHVAINGMAARWPVATGTAFYVVGLLMGGFLARFPSPPRWSQGAAWLVGILLVIAIRWVVDRIRARLADHESAVME